MKLLNDLFYIDEKYENGKVGGFKVSVNPEHFIYKAHFPKMPVTPGVCIVQMAREILECQLDKRLKTVYVKNVKFLAVLTPDKNKRVNFDITKLENDDNNKQYKAMVNVSDDNNAIAKLSFVCQ